MRVSKTDAAVFASLVMSILCGAVAYAIPVPITCGPQCKQVWFEINCDSGNTSWLSNPDCQWCGNNGCTVGGDPSALCVPAGVMDVDVFKGGVPFCRACTPQDTFIEAFPTQGEVHFSQQGVPRKTCLVVP